MICHITLQVFFFQNMTKRYMWGRGLKKGKKMLHNLWTAPFQVECAAQPIHFIVKMIITYWGIMSISNVSHSTALAPATAWWWCYTQHYLYAENTHINAADSEVFDINTPRIIINTTTPYMKLLNITQDFFLKMLLIDHVSHMLKWLSCGVGPFLSRAIPTNFKYSQYKGLQIVFHWK